MMSGPMRYTLVTVIFLQMIGGIIVPSAFANDDLQYWHKYQLKTLESDRFLVRVDGEQRLRENISEAFLASVQSGFLIKAGAHFDFGPFYKFQHSKSLTGREADENRWSLEANLKQQLGSFGIKDRNLFEYRDLNTQDGWRYRNQITFSRDLTVKSYKFTPFISEEPFFDFDAAFNQNRASVGASLPMTKNLTLTVYYLLRSVESGREWTEEHVLGTTLTLSV